MSESPQDPNGPQTASPAGIYDHLLGGDAGTAADREAASRIIAALPVIPQVAWANRGFLMRAVTWMARERGIRQFIDVGAGFPAQRPTHEVARAVAPGCRVLYTDNDPAAVARGSRMLDGVPGTAVIEADLRQPGALFGHPEARRLIDLSLPTGLLVVAVTQFVADEDDPWSLVARHMAPLATGSCLALSAPTADHKVESQVERVESEYAHSSAGVNQTRTREEIERFFSGLEIAAPYEGAIPGVAFVGLWGCDDPEAADDEASRWFYAGVGTKLGM